MTARTDQPASDGSRPRRRGNAGPRSKPSASRLLIALATLSALGLSLFAPIATAQAASNAISLRIYPEEELAPAVEVRGSSGAIHPLGPFGITASLGPIPCQGLYRLVAEEENQRSGETTVFRASLSIAAVLTRPPSIECGEELPGRAGTGIVALKGDGGVPFRMQGHRGGPGNFNGTLTLGRLPACEVPYTLSGRFDLGGSNVSFFCRAIVSSSVFDDGRETQPGPGC